MNRLVVAAGVCVGMLVAGFGLIVFGWLQTRTRSDVAAQAPYVVSAGLTGLVLVAVGAALLAVLILRNGERGRFEVMAELVEALEDA